MQLRLIGKENEFNAGLWLKSNAVCSACGVQAKPVILPKYKKAAKEIFAAFCLMNLSARNVYSGGGIGLRPFLRLRLRASADFKRAFSPGGT